MVLKKLDLTHVDRFCQCDCFTATASSYKCVVEIRMKVKFQGSCGPNNEDPIIVTILKG